MVFVRQARRLGFWIEAVTSLAKLRISGGGSFFSVGAGTGLEGPGMSPTRNPMSEIREAWGKALIFSNKKGLRNTNC